MGWLFFDLLIGIIQAATAVLFLAPAFKQESLGSLLIGVAFAALAGSNWSRFWVMVEARKVIREEDTET